MQKPREEHMEAVRRVARYLKGTAGQGILLRQDCNLQLIGFCDADWGVCPLSRKSLTGYFMMLGDSPISWKTKKQSTVSRSSAEAEYRSMAAATSELVWLRTFLAALGIFFTKPMRLFCDSQAALHIANNPVYHERTKHIEIDYYFVREKIEDGLLALFKIHTKEQPADIFTKAVGRNQFKFLRSKLGILDPHAPT